MRVTPNTLKIAMNYSLMLAVWAILLFGIGWNPIVALLPAYLAFFGFYYVFNPVGGGGSGAQQLRADARAKLDECREHIARIRAVAERVQAVPVKERLLRICAQADQIVGSGKELSLSQATRLEYIFQQAGRILDPYALVVERKDERAIWMRMKHEVEQGDVFRALDRSLGDLRTQLDKSDALEVDAAIAALKALTSEGL
jgi:hypothetical protein